MITSAVLLTKNKYVDVVRYFLSFLAIYTSASKFPRCIPENGGKFRLHLERCHYFYNSDFFVYQ
jgi:hypothetical protein